MFSSWKCESELLLCAIDNLSIIGLLDRDYKSRLQRIL